MSKEQAVRQVQQYSTCLSEPSDTVYERTVRGRRGSLVRVSAERDDPPTIDIQADIPGMATVRVSLSRKSAKKLADSIREALDALELDAVHNA